MGHDEQDFMEDMCRCYRTIFDEMGRDEQGYYYWKKSAGDSWESAEPEEPQEPKSAKEKLEQAEIADFEVLDESPLALTYAN